jgi:tetratricopeptide (TPR) repeat protein
MKRTLVVLILFCSFHATAQTPVAPTQSESAAQRLFAAEQWQQLAQSAESISQRSAELNYYYGVALAHLGRLDDAHQALLAARYGRRDDKRFDIELAGVAYKQKNYTEAAGYLRKALRLDPQDAYANDFLATIYFLQGNYEAALKYWNRVEKPRVGHLGVEPPLRVEPTLLDHALAFSAASVLHLDDLVTTEARLDNLEIFPSYRFELDALPEGDFDVALHASERNGWGNTRLEGLLRFFRGAPYQEVHPEYFNLGGRAINVVSLMRWDAQKRRLWASLSGPGVFGREGDLKWRYRLGIDLRNENWELRQSFTGPAPVLAALNLRREGFNAGVTRLVGPRLRWSLGAELSHRDYRDVLVGTVLTPQLMAKGYELKQASQIDYELWRMPEHRFIVSSSVGLETGRIWSTPARSYAQLQGAVQSRWLPRARDDDYETQWRLRAGGTVGQLPFDELFMLGLERDNNLPLRAHIGTRDGRKGSAPLGSNYVLSNLETDKNIYSNGLVKFKLGPFVDIGKITGVRALGSNGWLVDAGVQAKVSVLGVGIAFSYGRDLRAGHYAFYSAVAPPLQSSLVR